MPARRAAAHFAVLLLSLNSLNPVPTGAEPAPTLSQFTSSVQRELEPLIERYGPDAVNLQGLLLKRALDAGSQLEASCGIAGLEESGARRELHYRLDTGIVFKDPSTPQARARSIWKLVLEPALREARRLNAAADHVVVFTEYRHAAFERRGELPALLESGAAVRESSTFTLRREDVATLAGGGEPARAAARRVAVTIDQRGVEIDLGAREGE